MHNKNTLSIGIELKLKLNLYIKQQDKENIYISLFIQPLGNTSLP